METKYIIFGVIALVILFVIVYIKMTIDEKKGVDSEEKRRVREIINKVVGSSYRDIYATWEDFSLGGGGRTVVTETVYHYYAVGFKPGILCVVPLSFDGGDISYGEVQSFTKDNVGMVNAKAGKNWIELYDLDGKELVKLMVGPSETKEDKYHPVNIQQKEEYEAFCQFIGEFMREVNEFHNVEVSGKIGKPLVKKN